MLAAAQTWTNNSAGTLTVTSPVSGAFALTTSGAGTILLSGPNTYTGGTTISGGTLVLNNPGTTEYTYNGGNIAINNGSTLRVSTSGSGQSHLQPALAGRDRPGVSDTCGCRFSAVFPVFLHSAERMPQMQEHPGKHGTV